MLRNSCPKLYIVAEETKLKLSKAKTGKNRDENSLTAKSVNQYTLDDMFIKNWASATQVFRIMGFDNSFIAKCCNGQKEMAYGFKWQYA